MGTSINAEKTKKWIHEKVSSGQLKNSDLVQIIELCGMFLNLKTITHYARENKISYNGVKKTRNIIELFGNKYVLDNV